jgi:SAM-dependent methyltransferase
MRENDDYGYSLKWLDERTAVSYEDVSIAREQLNLYAHRDAQLAETGTTQGQFKNLPYPVSVIGGFLKDIDAYQDKLQDEGIDYPTCLDFLEVGCGSAVKATMAAEIFAYRAHAIDNSPEHVTSARETVNRFNQEDHVTVELADASTFNEYSDYDIIYLNRLYVGPAQQTVLENRIYRDMRPGTYLILVNGLSEWPDPIVRNTVNGAVYRKPLLTTAISTL